MSRKAILVAVVSALLVGGVGWWALFAGSGESELALSGQPSASPSGEFSIEGQWEVGSDSEVGYRVREQLARLPAKNDAVGRTNAVTGTLTVTDGVVTDLDLTADVSTLTSDESRRDNKIRTLGLESDTYPEATFTLTEPVPVPSTLTDTGIGSASVTGDLTIHGATREVTIEVELQQVNGRVEVVGSHTFEWDEFEMERPNIGGFVTVEDEATMEFKLVFEKA